MIEIEIPKDITKYEAKLAGIVTPRQAICVAIAAVCAFGVRALFKMIGVSNKFETFGMMAAVAIPLLFAVWKPYGMKLEEFLETAFVNNVLAPTKRKYLSENEFRIDYDKIVKEEKHVIGAYNKLYNVKVPHRRINDPKDKPRQKVNKLNPELTGYL